MSIATKNGSIIVKNGSVAEGCECCASTWKCVNDDANAGCVLAFPYHPAGMTLNGRQVTGVGQQTFLDPFWDGGGGPFDVTHAFDSVINANSFEVWRCPVFGPTEVWAEHLSVLKPNNPLGPLLYNEWCAKAIAFAGQFAGGEDALYATQPIHSVVKLVRARWFWGLCSSSLRIDTQISHWVHECASELINTQALLTRVERSFWPDFQADSFSSPLVVSDGTISSYGPAFYTNIVSHWFNTFRPSQPYPHSINTLSLPTFSVSVAATTVPFACAQ